MKEVVHLQIHQLEYFSEVAKCKSLNKAAEELMISQPSLSKSIKNLEKELEIKVFNRTNKGVELTVEGKKLYEYVRVVMKQLELIRGLKKEKDKDVLHISCFHNFDNGIILGEFYNNTKDIVEVSMRESRVIKTLEEVENLTSEIGIVQIKKMQHTEFKKELRKRALDCNFIKEDKICVNVSENHPLYNRKSVSMKELLPYMVIRVQDDYFSNLYYFNKVDGIRFTEFKKTMFVNSNSGIIQMLKSSNGIRFGILSERESLKKYGIGTLLIDNCEDTSSIYWVKRKKEILSKNAQKFLKVFCNYYLKKL